MSLPKELKEKIEEAKLRYDGMENGISCFTEGIDFVLEWIAKQQPVEAMVYEDQLPEMDRLSYSAWYDKSKLVDGVRMGPSLSSQSYLWSKIWNEVKMWYGDIKKLESTAQFEQRIADSYFISMHPLYTSPLPSVIDKMEENEWKDFQFKSDDIPEEERSRCPRCYSTNLEEVNCGKVLCCECEVIIQPINHLPK